MKDLFKDESSLIASVDRANDLAEELYTGLVGIYGVIEVLRQDGVTIEDEPKKGMLAAMKVVLDEMEDKAEQLKGTLTRAKDRV